MKKKALLFVYPALVILISHVLIFHAFAANSASDGQKTSSEFATRFVYPILFIHGYCGEGKGWQSMVDVLTKRGFRFGGDKDWRNLSNREAAFASIQNAPLDEPVLAVGDYKPGDFYTISLSDNNDLTFKEQGREVGLAVKTIRMLTGADKVILAGHSMGGLSARAYIQYPDLYQEDVQAVIFMATPHLGSFLANIHKKYPKAKSLSLDVSKRQFTQFVIKGLLGSPDWKDSQPVKDAAYLLLVEGLRKSARIDATSKATAYLAPDSPQLRELNQLDFPQGIEIVNLIAQLAPKRFIETLTDSMDALAASPPPALGGLTRLELQAASAVLKKGLQSGTFDIMDRYEGVICDFLELCEDTSYTAAFSARFKVIFSDLVVSVPSQMFELFPLARDGATQKDRDLYRSLADRVDVHFANVDHLAVPHAHEHIWQAIRKYVKWNEPYSHIVFVIDSSGSMKKTDPQRVRVNGIGLLMRKLMPEIKISIIDFDHQTKILCQNVPAGDGAPEIDQALEQIDAVGDTHMGKALEAAIAICEKTEGKGIIFLLTDGRNNGKKDILQISKSAAGRFPIFTVGLSDAVNEGLLARIAQITSGEYFKAKDARHLFEKLNAFFSQASQEITLLSETGVILPNETREFVLLVDPTITTLSMVLSWPGSRIDLEAVGPDGTRIHENGVDAKFFKSKSSVIAMLNNHESGAWKIRLTGVDVAPNGEEFRLVVNGKSGLQPILDIRSTYPQGGFIPLRVRIDGNVGLGLKISGRVTDPDGKVSSILDMNKFLPEKPGDYHIRLTLEGNLPDGQPFIRILERDIHVTPREDKSIFVPEIDMWLRWIPPGGFAMGSQTGEADECPVHPVVLTRGFWMAESEVTQGMWEKVMGANPSVFKSGANYPVENVSFADAQAFLAQLGAMTGLDLRLPTEAQWEYACRAGTSTRFWWGDDYGEDHVRCDKEWSLGHNPVKSFSPNEWGFYDMHSNVWEWCLDWYSPTYYENRTMEDPLGPRFSEYKVARGGAWSYGPDEMTSSGRTAVFPDRKLGNLGFRFVAIEKK